MTTNHQIVFGNSNDMKEVEDESIDLIVTSPPYPMMMIDDSLWDSLFISMNPKIEETLRNNPTEAFEMMHQELDKVWDELIADYLSAGGQAIIDERTAKWDQYFPGTDMLP